MTFRTEEIQAVVICLASVKLDYKEKSAFPNLFTTSTIWYLFTCVNISFLLSVKRTSNEGGS